MSRKFFALLLFLSLAASLAVQAKADDRVFIYRYRPAPVYIYRPVPVQATYDPEARFAGSYAIQGVVTASVPYHMNVRVRNDVYSVDLHDGTLIKPRGITLQPTMVVNVAGYWSGSSFHANRIIVVRY